MVKIERSSPDTNPAEEKQPQTLDEFKEAIRQVEGPLLHTVMITFRETATDSDIAQLIEELRSLQELPGVMALMVRGESLDQRKGRIVLEQVVFENGQAFLDWREHPRHQAFAERLRGFADWVISDSEVDQHVVDVAQKLGGIGVGAVQTEVSPS